MQPEIKTAETVVAQKIRQRGKLLEGIMLCADGAQDLSLRKDDNRELTSFEGNSR